MAYGHVIMGKQSCNTLH